jgi:hypothetical protein
MKEIKEPEVRRVVDRITLDPREQVKYAIEYKKEEVRLVSAGRVPREWDECCL